MDATELNLKNGEFKEYIERLHNNFKTGRGVELSQYPEDTNLLGFEENKMVFEKESLTSEETCTVPSTCASISPKKMIIVQKVQQESDGNKFLFIKGKKLKIKLIKPDKSLLQTALNNRINKKLESSPEAEVAEAQALTTEFINPYFGVPKSEISETEEEEKISQYSTPMSSSKLDSKSNKPVINIRCIRKPTECFNDRIERKVIDFSNSNNKSNSINKTLVLTSKRSLTVNDMNNDRLKIDQRSEMGGMKRITNVINGSNQGIPLTSVSNNMSTLQRSDPKNGNVKILTNLLFVNPNKMANSDLCSNCNCLKSEKKVLQTTATNTEKTDSVDREMQTEKPLDVLLDSIIAQCANDDPIIGNNVNMGYGPILTPLVSRYATENEKAKLQFHRDLQTCLIWDSGNLPIHRAVVLKDLAVVKRQCIVLKARGADINIINSHNATPLQLAVIHNVDMEIVRVLLQYQADLSILDPDGNNVLHLAVEYNRIDLLNLFLDNKSSKLNIDHFNYDGLTPLMRCAFYVDRIDMAESLLKKGAQPNLRDLKSGRTAMFHAAENHNTPLVSLLLDYCADTKIRNFFGTSVHDAMFELEDIPKEIKFPILGRDAKVTQRRKMHQKESKRFMVQMKRKKLEIVPTLQKILSDTKFVVNNGNIDQ